MHPLLAEIARFLPWCWFVNMSLTVFGYASRVFPWIGRHDWPLDAKMRLADRHRLLGDSTTLGGLIVVLMLGAAGAAAWPGLHFFSYSALVYAGHALGSFAKRRLGVPRGAFVPFVDHGDYVIVAGVYAYAIGAFSLPGLLLSYLATIAVTPAITWAAHALRIRERAL